MNRLLQGDVGSGKTVGGADVHVARRRQRVSGGYDGANRDIGFPALRFRSSACEKIGEGGLLTGSTKRGERREIDEGLRSGEIDILIGTHALMQDSVRIRQSGFRHNRRT